MLAQQTLPKAILALALLKPPLLVVWSGSADPLKKPYFCDTEGDEPVLLEVPRFSIEERALEEYFMRHMPGDAAKRKRKKDTRTTWRNRKTKVSKASSVWGVTPNC